MYNTFNALTLATFRRLIRGLIVAGALSLFLTSCEEGSSTDSGASDEQNADGTPTSGLDAEVSQINFDSISARSLVLAGVSGEEQSTLVITAVGPNGNPVPNADITFTLVPANTSVTLLNDNDGDGAIQLVTNIDGNAQVNVQSGTSPANVRVRAVNPATNVSKLSDNIAVSTGVPVQNRLSLALSTFSPEGACCSDGVEVSATIRSTDSLGNAIPDGTTFQFFASESGLIGPNSCQTTNGACSVTWESSGPRPTDGTVNIVVYTTGNEQFNDANNDGLFNLTDGDTHTTAFDITEPYQDYDDSGDFNAGDEFIDVSPTNGRWDDAINDGWTENTIIWTDATFVISEADTQPIVFDCDAITPTIESTLDMNGLPEPCGITIAGSQQNIAALVSDVNGNSLEEGAVIEWILKPDDSSNSDWEITGLNDLSYTVTNTETGPNLSPIIDFDAGSPVVTGGGRLQLVVESPGRPKVVVDEWTINVM